LIASQGQGQWSRCECWIEFPDVAREPIRAELDLSVDDLLRLAQHLRQHIGENLPHPIEASKAFVPRELGFEMQAYEGDCESWNDGEFTLRFMLYCGPPDRSRNALYLGVQGVVEIPEVLQWCQRLEEVALKIRGQGTPPPT
jgi:hypothetical protein